MAPDAGFLDYYSHNDSETESGKEKARKVEYLPICDGEEVRTKSEDASPRADHNPGNASQRCQHAERCGDVFRPEANDRNRVHGAKTEAQRHGDSRG
jgi:hypothetical protein